MDFRLTNTYFTVDHIHVLPLIALLIVAIVPFWNIFRKTGHSGVLSFLMLIPGVNLIVLYVVAFSRPRFASSSS